MDASFRRAQSPSEEEIRRNRRSRSAKLRVATRVVDKESVGMGSPVSSSERRDKRGNGFVGKKQIEKLRKQLDEQEE